MIQGSGDWGSQCFTCYLYLSESERLHSNSHGKGHQHWSSTCDPHQLNQFFPRTILTYIQLEIFHFGFGNIYSLPTINIQSKLVSFSYCFVWSHQSLPILNCTGLRCITPFKCTGLAAPWSSLLFLMGGWRAEGWLENPILNLISTSIGNKQIRLCV